MEFSEKELDMVKYALEYLHDADLCEFGNENIEILEKLMDKMNIKYSSQL